MKKKGLGDEGSTALGWESSVGGLRDRKTDSSLKTPGKSTRWENMEKFQGARTGKAGLAC